MACHDKKPEQKATTPWGTAIEDTLKVDTTAQYSLSEILESGAIRVITVSGEDTYFTTAHGAELGVQYLMATQLAHHLGVGVEVVQCLDTLEMVKNLREGMGDLIIAPLSKSVSAADSLIFCGPEINETAWAVMYYNRELADSINAWFKPEMLAKMKEMQEKYLSGFGGERHVYASFLDKEKGIISEWDHLFKKYAETANLDWRLLAAICYQESCFDPNAVSWAGACGLMQIMPKVAQAIGLPIDSIFDPEKNVATSARMINELTMLLRDVPDPNERMCFLMACYNGGIGHVRDAMALTEKYKGNKYSWEQVSEFILKLSQPQYYRDPVVKNGYMRGTETHDYVELVSKRYEEYTGSTRYIMAEEFENANPTGVLEAGEYAGVSTTPKRASHENKYEIE
ncbi:MAG: transglycosylase SLT domain-containing protein [Prevotella sp.]|nr:transglycosylase SLT domain-containing protein [Prevotella sp.]